MPAVRGLVLWLSSAVLGSFLCTLAALLIRGGPFVMGPIFWAGLAATIPFTLAGSALLLIAFASLRAYRIAARYVILALLGFAAGAAMMIPTGLPILWAVGAGYGLTTALLWIGLHKLLYGAN